MNPRLWINLLGLIGYSDFVRSADVSYQKDIKPILTARCVTCHGAIRQKAGLRLDASPLIRKGSKNGPVVVPGKSGESLLLDAVTGKGRPRMPPEKDGEALPEKEVALLRAWIDQGANAPDEPIPEDPRKHWAYQTPRRHPVPDIQNPKSPIRNPIDSFIVSRLEQEKIERSPEAVRATLVRRLYLDLVGLPPSREALEAARNDKQEDWYEKLVERLLASPQYGERWGRHWMDVWRYSDPFGFGMELRYSQLHIWRWRDWIIESLNDDKGYDRMIQEMLAGDELAPSDPQTLRATGYLARNWYKFNRNAWMQDTVEHTGMAFLGTTLRCARCHDHKYDPVSQADYYRFRAFFEPHDIRIDPVPGQPDIKKDGIPRAFDAKLTEPTYLFLRGDDRAPDKSRVLTPGAPSILCAEEVAIKPVQFSPRDFARTLIPAADAEKVKARAELQMAVKELETAGTALTTARQQLAQFGNGPATPEPARSVAFLHDNFATARADVWKMIRGQWSYEKGRLVQKAINKSWSMIASKKEHPRDFMGRVRYRTTGGGAFFSVGLSFDVIGEQSFQAVYTSTKARTVQTFHRAAGKEIYPNAGIVPCPVDLNKEVTLDFAVRDDLLNVWVDGQLKIVYKLPTPRRNGVFALWNLDAASEFIELRLEALPASVALNDRLTDGKPSPLTGAIRLTKADLERGVKDAEASVALAEKKTTVAKTALDAIDTRLVAEQARFAEPVDPRSKEYAQAAAKAERQLAILRAEIRLVETEKGMQAAPIAMAKKALEDARAAATKNDENYTPLVVMSQTTSSGRRLALARWITRADHPLTARVAVNHVWMRHFGKPLVASVANFGLAGKKPTHPELLDWLAVRFVEDGWSFKKLHHLIVTSQAYRLSSSVPKDSPNVAIDPDNRLLWRMNARRMESEVVRDSLLAMSGQLDSTMRGPILDEKLGLIESRRRSVYFRLTTEHKMLFLDLFDQASPNECYERRESVVPQQALALSNSVLALNQARLLARALKVPNDEAFIVAAFEQVLGRQPTSEEQKRCEQFLKEQNVLLKNSGKLTPYPADGVAATPPSTDPVIRARENLVHVLVNHNDFVTIR